MTIIAAETNLVNAQVGDLLVFHDRGLFPQFDVLGKIITLGEGNVGRDIDGDGKLDQGPGKGDCTHISVVRQTVDPSAEVELVRTESDGSEIFKIKDGSNWFTETKRPGVFDGEIETIRRMQSRMGIKSEATWPAVQEWPIDWENAWMEVWRVRGMRPDIAKILCAMLDDQIGYHYDVPQFISFGNLRAANSYICSQYASENIYRASLAAYAITGENLPPICLTPDVAGMRDQMITPNDIINSGLAYKIAHQGRRTT